MLLQSTKVQCTCVSKKQKFQYYKDSPTAHEIELEVPYDTKSIYWKLSGGTNMVLNTINQDAADMFIIGGVYNLIISPVPVELPVLESEQLTI